MTLKLEDITFAFNDKKRVLNGVDLSISEAKTVAIVGASGSGKSTLLRLICGIIQKEKNNFFEGNILINGFSPADYVRQGKVGFMFQEPTLFPNLTVKENIEFPIKLKRKDGTRNEVTALICSY